VEKLEELKIKRLMKEYEYLTTEYEFRKEFSEKHKTDFLSEISKRRKELNIEEPPLNIIIPEEESAQNIDIDGEIDSDILDEDYLDDEKEEDPEQLQKDIKLKKVFREIVKICHPDKVLNLSKRKHLTEIYIKSKVLYNERNLLGLYLIAIDIGIEIKIELSDLSDIDNVLEEKKAQVKSFESSYLWIWINSNDEDKIKIIDLFIKNNG
jgi:hypothetical protein